MLPEKLTIRGFLSYREEQILDFSKFHVALVTGENGHGKSSILDAISFALFSMARGVEGNKRGLKDLVSNGDSSLKVTLQFLQDGNRYRVIRTYDTTRNGSNVVLQLEKNDGFNNISENTIRETDKKIESIVHMNYETFITSSFVMQGRSDYFTAKNPTERIEILREMLNLNIYERARDTVREKLRETQFKMVEIARRVADEKEELKKLPQVEILLKEKEDKIKEIRLDIENFNRELEELRKKISDKEKLENNLIYIENEIKDINSGFEQKLKSENGLRKLLERLEEILARENEIKQSYKELLTVKKQFEEMTMKNIEYGNIRNRIDRINSNIEKEISLKKEKIKSLSKSLEEIARGITNSETGIKKEEGLLKEEIDNLQDLKVQDKELSKNMDMLSAKKVEVLKQVNEKEKLESKLKDLQSREQERLKSISLQIKDKKDNIKLFEQKISDFDYTMHEKLLFKEEENLKNVKAQLEFYEKSLKELTERKNILNSEIQNIQKNIDDLIQKMSLISEGVEDKCPLCGSPLSEEHRLEISRNYSLELDGNKEEIHGKSEIFKSTKKEISELKVVSREDFDATSRRVEEKRAELIKMKSIVNECKEQNSKLKNDLVSLNRIMQKGVLDSTELTELHAIKEGVKKLSEASVNFEEIEKNEIKFRQEENKLSKKITDCGLRISVHIANIKNLKANLAELENKKVKTGQEKFENETLLSSGDFMKTEKDAVTELEKTVFDLHFDPEILKKLRLKKKELLKYENEFIELNGASVKREEIGNNLLRISEEKKELDKSKSEKSRSLLKTREQIKSFEGIEDIFERRKKTYETTGKELENILDEKIRIEENYKKLRALVDSVLESEKKIEIARNELEILNICDDMFGKQGIPVSIIRSVLPRIEMLADELLLKMTDGKMQIKFSTVKNGKNGEKNTFDINVYDRGERRRYELFSGGEQFRINLAIRIGISLFLSSLSGTSLEMLVVDEGFGSQDEPGKEKILKEINAIKDRFKKILVISHIGDVKESFEYEIKVVKDNYTSRIYVV
jgi:exonuclease SbcC